MRLAANCIFIYPSGYRDWTNGLWIDGSGGDYYWSSSVPNDTHGSHFGFGISVVNPDRVNVRGFGFSVRCVAD